MLQTLSATSGRMVVWIAAGVFIILLAGLWLFSVRKPSTQKKTDPKIAKTVFRQKMPQNRISVKTVDNKKVITVKVPDRPAAQTKSQPAPVAEPPTKQPAPIKIDPAAKGKTVAAAAPTIPQTQIKSGQAELERAEADKAEVAESPIIPPTPTKSGQAELEKPAADKAMAPEQVTTASLKRDSRPKTIPQQEEKPAPVVVKLAGREIGREKWLLSQDGAAYTIQIIGVSNEKSMLDFIKKNQMLIQNKIAYYESTFRGKPWFELLYGIYPDKQAARLAANQLPENLHHAGPWIRSMAVVQKEIDP
ncbi:MAG: hypothetical protein GY850_22505 [bacterium]|nr:hypothetical protein [bacterium]